MGCQKATRGALPRLLMKSSTLFTNPLVSCAEPLWHCEAKNISRLNSGQAQRSGKRPGAAMHAGTARAAGAHGAVHARLKSALGLCCMQVNAEVDDMYKEFQREKEDLLESIRMLQDQMQLKDMVIEAFTPTEEVQKVCTL
eukprot:395124-Pelagomonas_calceolata.AAC.1